MTPNGVRTATLAAGAALSAYHLAIRPWHRRWGATIAEVHRTLPGDALVPDARYRTTRAITIDAPIPDVWPWIVQLGQDRGGFYSYDRLERLVGAEIYNTDVIHPEWQERAVGDVVRLAPEDRFSGQAQLTVAILEPERALVFGPPPPAETGDGSWALILEREDENRTRLLVRTQGRTANMPPFFFLFDVVHFVMERKMMLGIKERAERRARATPPVASTPTGDGARHDGRDGTVDVAADAH